MLISNIRMGDLFNIFKMLNVYTNDMMGFVDYETFVKP